jgi:hypothetical protein
MDNVVLFIPQYLEVFELRWFDFSDEEYTPVTSLDRTVSVELVNESLNIDSEFLENDLEESTHSSIFHEKTDLDE